MTSGANKVCQKCVDTFKIKGDGSCLDVSAKNIDYCQDYDADTDRCSTCISDKFYLSKLPMFISRFLL